MPNDFDENGNMRNAHIFPSGIEKIKQALGIVPPAMIYFVGTPQPGSILDALKTPNKDVDFATIERGEMLRRYHCVDDMYRDGLAEFLNAKMSPYTGPDMNEVDAALEAIERMEE